MKTTSPTPKPSRKITIDLKTVPVNYKAATRLFCQRYLAAALQMFSWNVTKCAKALGISRRTLQLRMRQFDISQGANSNLTSICTDIDQGVTNIETVTAVEQRSLGTEKLFKVKRICAEGLMLR